MGFVYILPTLMGDNAGGLSFFDFKEGLKAAGWTVLASGDGLALFSAVGDVITVRGDGAGGVNVLAWVRLGAHAGNPFEICVQMGNGSVPGNALRIGARTKVSASAGFTGGAPSPSRVPSAADEFVYRGAGSDAAPTDAPTWNNESNSTLDAAGEHLFFGLAEDTIPSRFVFGFVQDFSPFACRGGWMHDRLQLQQVPLRGLTDAEPYLIYQAGLTNLTDTAAFGELELNSIGFQSCVAIGSLGVWVAIKVQHFTQGGTYPTISGTNPFLAGAHDLIPLVGSLGGAAGSNTKGVPTLIRGIAQQEAAGDRDQLYTVSNKIRSWVRLNSVAIPWNGTPISASWTDERDAVLWNLTGDRQFAGGRDADIIRMRATDTTLARVVYWDSQYPDPGGDRYTGPGPLTGVTVSLKLRRT